MRVVTAVAYRGASGAGAISKASIMDAGLLAMVGAAEALPVAAIPEQALVSLMSNHVIHHRGQLTVYLRLRDVPLPSIYGPTADEG